MSPTWDLDPSSVISKRLEIWSLHVNFPHSESLYSEGESFFYFVSLSSGRTKLT